MKPMTHAVSGGVGGWGHHVSGGLRFRVLEVFWGSEYGGGRKDVPAGAGGNHFPENQGIR